MMKNLTGKKQYFLAVAVFFVMVCFSACSQESVKDESSQSGQAHIVQEQIEEQTVEEQILQKQLSEQQEESDTEAPEGILKGHFLIATQKVTPGDFVENVADVSKVTEGFRNIRMLYGEEQTKERLKIGIAELDKTETELDLEKIFDLTWETASDCYEEKNISNESLESTFEPSENGVYEMEVVASDSYGNASVAKVYVLYDKAETTLAEFENYVAKMSAKAESEANQQSQSEAAQKNGFDRGKAEEAFAKVNEQRAANGVQALVWDESLYDLACVRAKEIVSNFSHQRPDGSYIGDIMISQYGASGCGENIASNYKSTSNLVNGWLNSQGHKENMLNSRFTAGVMACYCYNGSYYWVNLFKQ